MAPKSPDPLSLVSVGGSSNPFLPQVSKYFPITIIWTLFDNRIAQQYTSNLQSDVTKFVWLEYLLPPLQLPTFTTQVLIISRTILDFFLQPSFVLVQAIVQVQDTLHHRSTFFAYQHNTIQPLLLSHTLVYSDFQNSSFLMSSC